MKASEMTNVELAKALMSRVPLDSDRHDDLREAAEKKPEPCPFCHSETEIVSSNNIYQVSCVHCLYLSEGCTNEESAIAAHNRVARAVEAVKEGKTK